MSIRQSLAYANGFSLYVVDFIWNRNYQYDVLLTIYLIHQ